MPSGSDPRPTSEPAAELRVVIFDREAARALAALHALERCGASVSTHGTSRAFWIAVRRERPSVIVLEVVPPLLSAARTIALATELLPRAPGVVLYGWGPSEALARVAERIPNAIVIARDARPSLLLDATVRAHELAAAATSPNRESAIRLRG